VALQHQLDWLKHQLFGRKSEKQLIEHPRQASLFTEREPSPPATPKESQVQSHTRTQRSSDEVNDAGLRFDESVPQKIIELSLPEREGKQADQYDIIDYKDTCRLAQQPGSYVLLVYRRQVVCHKRTQSVGSVPAPTGVLEGSYVDVSLLAGLTVEKAVYHLPLYRQHQRMLDSGIRVSRASLVNWIQKRIELLRPIYQAQLRQILQSKVLAMDEVSIKAGRKGKGKMKQTYFCPLYGDLDEVALYLVAKPGGCCMPWRSSTALPAPC